MSPHDKSVLKETSPVIFCVQAQQQGFIPTAPRPDFSIKAALQVLPVVTAQMVLIKTAVNSAYSGPEI